MTADLPACLHAAFGLLAAGVADRRHAFHAATLATVGLDGAPDARTLVLRGFDAAARTLRLHSDARTGKVAALARDPRAALHFYDAAAGLQLRMACRATLHGDDAVAEAAWAASRDFSRMIYAVEPAPGTPVAAPPPASRDAASGRAWFRVILLRFDRLEVLDLDAAGHRRARFDWDADGAPTATWVVP